MCWYKWVELPLLLALNKHKALKCAFGLLHPAGSLSLSLNLFSVSLSVLFALCLSLSGYLSLSLSSSISCGLRHQMMAMAMAMWGRRLQVWGVRLRVWWLRLRVWGLRTKTRRRMGRRASLRKSPSRLMMDRSRCLSRQGTEHRPRWRRRRRHMAATQLNKREREPWSGQIWLR